MKAYKGFSADMTARLGAGRFQYEIGKTYEEAEAKTVRNGFHCCENPFECLSYYDLEKDRFCEVDIQEIDEDDAERIAGKKITIVKELSRKEFAFEGLCYLIKHMMREKWQQNRRGVHVAEDFAEAKAAGHIAIARGESPVVEASTGAYVGLIRELEPGHIDAAHFCMAAEPGTYSLSEEGELTFARKEAV